VPTYFDAAIEEMLDSFFGINHVSGERFPILREICERTEIDSNIQLLMQLDLIKGFIQIEQFHKVPARAGWALLSRLSCTTEGGLPKRQIFRMRKSNSSITIATNSEPGIRRGDITRRRPRAASGAVKTFLSSQKCFCLFLRRLRRSASLYAIY
jgi:hypothetical protein